MDDWVDFQGFHGNASNKQIRVEKYRLEFSRQNQINVAIPT